MTPMLRQRGFVLVALSFRANSRTDLMQGIYLINLGVAFISLLQVVFCGRYLFLSEVLHLRLNPHPALVIYFSLGKNLLASFKFPRILYNI